MLTVLTRPTARFAILVLALCFSSCGLCRPRPAVTTVSPSSVVAGSSQFVITVNGSDFNADSFVTWNGSFRSTTFNSTHQLVALITAADVAVATSAQVRVFTPGDKDVTVVSASGVTIVDTTRCGGGNSNVVVVTVTTSGA